MFNFQDEHEVEMNNHSTPPPLIPCNIHNAQKREPAAATLLVYENFTQEKYICFIVTKFSPYTTTLTDWLMEAVMQQPIRRLHS